MHVLTKVFTVLVALLAVMLVPLVVVYAKNESNFKAKYEQASADTAAANQAAQRAQVSAATASANAQALIDDMNDEVGGLRQQLAARTSEVATLQGDLTTAKSSATQINAKISQIVTRLDSGQSLIEELVRESGQLRGTALAAERQNAELEKEYREQGRNLEVAESAVRSLQEELQRISDARNRAVQTISKYKQRYPDIDKQVGTGDLGGTPITIKITASIIDVQISEGVMLAEIDAGQRDGILEGMILTLGDANGNYLGRLRITRVDLNRATGVAETPYGDPAPVQLGHSAFAFPE